MDDEHISPWQDLLDGRYQTALAGLNSSIEDEKQDYDVFNRGFLYLILGEYELALKDFARDEERRRPNTTDSNFHFLGVTRLFLHDIQTALEMWEKALDAPYTDAAGGVIPMAMLKFAGIRFGRPELRKKGERLLKRKWSAFVRRIKKRTGDEAPWVYFRHPGLYAWPGAIVPYLLGELDEGQIMEVVNRFGDSVLQEKAYIQCIFYIGAIALQAGDVEKYRECMKECLKKNPGNGDVEYFVAKWEIENDFLGLAG